MTKSGKTDKTLQRVEHLEKAGHLVAGLSHEIKNSLAGVEAAIQVLLNELVVSDEHLSILLRMSQEVRRVELLMKDFLSFARPSSPQRSPMDTNSVLDSALSQSAGTVSCAKGNMKAIKIIKRYDAALPKAMADPVQMQKVFQNLFGNSVDAMPQGGTLTVETSYEPARNMIEVSISDTGGGISEENLDKIFEPFFTTKSHGTGLDLAICRRLVEQNNGRICADNNPNGGAIFEISLPVNTLEHE